MMGRLYKGGMWFKKKANISGFDTNLSVDGSDCRVTGHGFVWPVSNTLPDAADAGNYFYLPALGYYLSGQLIAVGSNGEYWSSSANPWNSNNDVQPETSTSGKRQREQQTTATNGFEGGGASVVLAKTGSRSLTLYGGREFFMKKKIR